MSCGNNYNGWGGGCGCANTVQYAPPACNPNFPTYCTALNDGNIVRLVGEDSAFCKYTVPAFKATASNTQAQSILTYNNVGNVSWGDGSSNKPIYIAPPDNTATGQALQSPTFSDVPYAGVSLQATTGTGQLVEFAPASSLSSKAQFPVVAPNKSTTTWGTIDNIIPNDGVVYRSSGTVAEASLGTNGQVLTMVSGVPAFATPNTPAFIDAQSIKLVYNDPNSILVSYGSLVLTNFATGAQIVKSGSGATYTLTINTGIGPGSMDVSATTASNYYYVYAIYNSATSTFSVVGSSQSTSPNTTNLGGYGTTNQTGYYRLIGVFYSGFNNQISSYYIQNGRNVYFGLTDQPQILPSTGSTQIYFGGAVTGLPVASVANKANLLLSATAQPVNQFVSCVISQAYSNGTSHYWVPYNYEVYGSCSIAGIVSGSSVYANFDMPIVSGAGYNINLAAAQTGATNQGISLTVAGCTLSIF